MSVQEIESQLLEDLFGDQKITELTQKFSSKWDEDSPEMHQQICHDLIGSSSWGIRLIRFLLRPDILNPDDQKILEDFYLDKLGDRKDRSKIDFLANIPRRISLLVDYMFDSNDKEIVF